jgi:hypothetical protein
MKLYAHSQDEALKAASATFNRVVTLRDTDAANDQFQTRGHYGGPRRPPE